MVRNEVVFFFPNWSTRTCSPRTCQFKTDEEEDVDNPEEQDEHGNLRGLIDDGDDDGEEEEEAPKSGSGGGSDSEEEVRHRRKKRSKFSIFLCFFFFSPCVCDTCGNYSWVSLLFMFSNTFTIRLNFLYFAQLC